ncbi:MAG: hypothetical protein KAK00_03125 [Nanoarchaeota archaeon]|nr:hypothetical protein [Nanoarchaeota archaeon]
MKVIICLLAISLFSYYPAEMLMPNRPDKIEFLLKRPLVGIFHFSDSKSFLTKKDAYEIQRKVEKLLSREIYIRIILVDNYSKLSKNTKNELYLKIKDKENHILIFIYNLEYQYEIMPSESLLGKMKRTRNLIYYEQKRDVKKGILNLIDTIVSIIGE